MSEPNDIAADSKCWCFTGTNAQKAIVYLLNQIAGGTMTPAEVAENSACWCFTGVAFERAAVYLLAQILAGGGGGGGGVAGITNMALGGSEPPSDGSVTTKLVFDTDNSYLWYNSGTVGSPTWNNV